MLIAKPRAIFSLHANILRDFLENRNLKDADPRDPTNALSLVGDEKKKLDSFLDKFISILANRATIKSEATLDGEEVSYHSWLKELGELPSSYIETEPIIIIPGGGYMKIEEDGSIAIYDKSEMYGKAPEYEVLDVLKKDFPDRRFSVKM